MPLCPPYCDCPVRPDHAKERNEMPTSTEGPPRRRRRSPESSTKTEPAPKTEPVTTTKPAPKDDIFQTAAHQASFPKVPDMQRGFQTIVSDIFAEGYDVVEEWKDIRAAMVISDALSPERLKRAANEQEDISIRAHRLYVIAKVEVSAYMRETEATFAAIRQSGIDHLEAQKAEGTRTKQITDKDAVSEAARMHPDEWADICTRRERAEAMLSQLLRVSESAKSRCYTVSNMMSPGARGV